MRNALWNRPDSPKPLIIQERDAELLRLVHRFRLIRPSTLRALLIERWPKLSQTVLTRRLRKLWQNRYLNRPASQRPTRILQEELVYELGRKGAELLGCRHPEKTGWMFCDHQLGVVQVLATFELACRALPSVTFDWHGHQGRQLDVIRLPTGETQLPDAYFTVRVEGYGRVHHFLELDRATVPLNRMAERYGAYFAWQRAERARGGLPNLRVMTVTTGRGRMENLRRVAYGVGRDSSQRKTWSGLLFSTLEEFDLLNPRNSLNAIYFLAGDSAEPTTLIPEGLLG